jgi:dGTPase
MLHCLVEHYSTHPAEMPADHQSGGRLAASGSTEALRQAVGYVAGMTDRFACVQAIARLGWTTDRLPRGFDSG